MTVKVPDLASPAGVLRRVMANVTAEAQRSWEIPELCHGADYYRETDDGHAIVVYPLVMGTVRVVVGPAGEPFYDDAWCYADPVAGLLAAACWDGKGDPPEGWFRNINSRRRRPAGDPALEFVAD
jgi:hypothetical protein